MTPEQKSLAELMCDISERCYCAGWMSNLEFNLWMIIQRGTPCLYGWGQITQEEIDKLKTLSAACDGWIAWDEFAGKEVFVPMQEWLRTYTEETA